MKNTELISQTLDALEIIAYNCDKTECRLTEKELFANLDEVYDLVDSYTNRLLSEIAEIEANYEDFCHCGDWEELHREVLFNTEVMTTLNTIRKEA